MKKNWRTLNSGYILHEMYCVRYIRSTELKWKCKWMKMRICRKNLECFYRFVAGMTDCRDSISIFLNFIWILTIRIQPNHIAWCNQFSFHMKRCVYVPRATGLPKGFRNSAVLDIFVWLIKVSAKYWTQNWLYWNNQYKHLRNSLLFKSISAYFCLYISLYI